MWMRNACAGVEGPWGWNLVSVTLSWRGVQSWIFFLLISKNISIQLIIKKKSFSKNSLRVLGLGDAPAWYSCGSTLQTGQAITDLHLELALPFLWLAEYRFLPHSLFVNQGNGEGHRVSAVMAQWELLEQCSLLLGALGFYKPVQVFPAMWK